jgi:hypothetical protein
MNFLKKGPELKLSSLRGGGLTMPPFLVDLYYDLRDRRLLLPLALVVVAIAAVPFLLGGGSKEEEAPPSAGGGGGSAVAVTSGSGSTKLAVVESTPGLRDYHKRLKGYHALDPFIQHYTAPDLKGAELNEAPEGSTSSAPTFTTTTTESGTIESSSPPETSTGGAPPSESPAPTTAPHEVFFFAWAIDVQITKSEAKSSSAARIQEAQVPAAQQPPVKRGPAPKGSKPEATQSKAPETNVRHKILPLTKLPGDKAPVVTYMGPSKQGRPLFLVSDKVNSVFGETKCVSGDDSCQLIEIDPEFPVLFLYGENEVHYKFQVLKMELVVTGHKKVDAESQNFSK